MIILANSAKVFTGTMNWLIIGLTMSANWKIFQCVNILQKTELDI